MTTDDVSLCDSHHPVLFSTFMIYHRHFNKSSMMDVTNGAGTVSLSKHVGSPPGFWWKGLYCAIVNLFF